MTSPRAPRRAALLAACLALWLAPLAAGCAAAPAPVHLPAKGAQADGRAVAQFRRPLSERQQVIAAFLGFTAADTAATNSGNATRARELLAPYLTPAADSSMVSAMATMIWSKHEIIYGSARTRILGVTISAATAVVHACVINAGGYKNTITGQPIAGTLGQPQTNEFNMFERAGGRWLYQHTTILGAPCGTRL
jgi:hypothetical protein